MGMGIPRQKMLAEFTPALDGPRKVRGGVSDTRALLQI
jgi:hypothetical protein